MNKSAFKKIFAWTVIFIFVLSTFPVSSFAEKGQRQVFAGVGEEIKHSIGRLLETRGSKFEEEIILDFL